MDPFAAADEWPINYATGYGHLTTQALAQLMLKLVPCHDMCHILFGHKRYEADSRWLW